MHIPILICGNPRSVSSLNPIRLFSGKWKLCADGIIDTILYPLPGTILDLQSAVTQQVAIIQAGTEKEITIYYEKMP